MMSDFSKKVLVFTLRDFKISFNSFTDIDSNSLFEYLLLSLFLDSAEREASFFNTLSKREGSAPRNSSILELFLIIKDLLFS